MQRGIGRNADDRRAEPIATLEPSAIALRAKSAAKVSLAGAVMLRVVDAQYWLNVAAAAR
jgi:hypothetical protein